MYRRFDPCIVDCTIVPAFGVGNHTGLCLSALTQIVTAGGSTNTIQEGDWCSFPRSCDGSTKGEIEGSALMAEYATEKWTKRLLARAEHCTTKFSSEMLADAILTTKSQLGST